jgi:predicted transcriptional regulator
MRDILVLPDKEKRIVNWLMRHKQSTLNEVAEYVGEDEVSDLYELWPLRASLLALLMYDRVRCITSICKKI